MHTIRSLNTVLNTHTYPKLTNTFLNTTLNKNKHLIPNPISFEELLTGKYIFSFKHYDFFVIF